MLKGRIPTRFKKRPPTVANRAFPVVGPSIWNDLLADVTSAESSIFRQRLKTHLFWKPFAAYFLDIT